MKGQNREEKMEQDDTPIFDSAYFEGGESVPKAIPALCDWCRESRAVVEYQGYFLCEKCAKNERER